MVEAITKTPLGRHLSYDLTEVSDPDVTGQSNLRNGPCTVHVIELDNTAASGTACWVKLYNNDGSDLTYGTTAPDIVLTVGAVSAADERVTWHIVGGISLTEALSMAACKEDGNAVTTVTDGTLVVRFVTV